MKSIVKHSLILAISMAALAGCSSGKDGKDGKDGTNSSNGSSSGIVKTVNCEGSIFGLSGAAGSALNGLRVEYTTVLTGTGDVYATANISNDYNQVSETSFYAEDQAGASTGTVELIADYHSTDDQGTWEVSLNRNTLITTVTYTDDSLGVQSPVVMNFTAAACDENNW